MRSNLFYVEEQTHSQVRLHPSYTHTYTPTQPPGAGFNPPEFFVALWLT